MEGVPRIPMLAFPLRRSGIDVPNFRTKIKLYIRDYYGESPDSYNKEISELEALRSIAIRASKDNTGCATLKKYYCQLNYLKSRFPIREKSPCAITFTWMNVFSDTVHNWTNISFEMASILYNIGALHSVLGALANRVSADGMKEACTHFQCAAWAFQQLNQGYSIQYFSNDDLTPEILGIMNIICLAQAQECILEKSFIDNRKSSINVKVAIQIYEYYGKVSRSLEGMARENYTKSSDKLIKYLKKWKVMVELKMNFYHSIAYLYLGEQSEEEKKFGARVGYYEAARDKLTAATKIAKSLDKNDQMHDTLNFTSDYMNGKYDISKKENEFIYHDKVPDVSAIRSEIKGASLVKGIPFKFDDQSISGPDIFSRLVPMEAHESSSLYSEEKAKVLRNYSELIEKKNDELDRFLINLQLDQLDLHDSNKKVPQELVDACATLNVDSSAISKLNGMMNKLSGMYHDVESNLKEIEDFFEALPDKDKKNEAYSEVKSDSEKFRQAQTVAAQTNETLATAMKTHVVNLQILMKPLDQVLDSIPSQPEFEEKDMQAINNMKKLREKVEQMQRQREMFENQLRESILNDDITKVLVVKQNSQDLESYFKQELQKHDKITALIDQNLLAQNNIMRAITETNAEYSETRRSSIELMNKRESKINALVSSFQAYDELIEKCKKGIDFYEKLNTNVEKLLAKLKSLWKAQEDKAKKSVAVAKPADPLSISMSTPQGGSNQPRLKDYLDIMKQGGIVPQANYYNPSDSVSNHYNPSSVYSTQGQQAQNSMGYSNNFSASAPPASTQNQYDTSSIPYSNQQQQQQHYPDPNQYSSAGNQVQHYQSNHQQQQQPIQPPPQYSYSNPSLPQQQQYQSYNYPSATNTSIQQHQQPSYPTPSANSSNSSYYQQTPTPISNPSTYVGAQQQDVNNYYGQQQQHQHQTPQQYNYNNYNQPSQQQHQVQPQQQQQPVNPSYNYGVQPPTTQPSVDDMLNSELNFPITGGGYKKY